MRSLWKFPYIDYNILVKFLKIKIWNFYIRQKKKRKKKFENPIIKIWKKSSVILSIFVGYSFLIYNGKKFLLIIVKSSMIGHKFGEFILTKKIGRSIHKQKRR